MSLQSMTGFARESGQNDYGTWTWEIRSVNAKGLECRLRLPSGFEGVDGPVRSACGAVFKRGNITATLTLKVAQGQSSYRINQELLDQLIQATSVLKKTVPDYQPVSLDGLLNVRGVVEGIEDSALSEEAQKVLEADIVSSFQAGLQSLRIARSAEGARLQRVFEDQLTAMSEEVSAAQSCADLQPEELKARLQRQVTDLLRDTDRLDEERLYQEAALLMTKADVREELDRLRAHLDQARDLIAQGSPCGRKLDFLCQEFNREANTLCSKAQGVTLTRHGLALKTTIEQFREQVQNIE